MKEIKDYLHLYLGAGCIMKASKGVTEEFYSTVDWSDIGYPHNIKALILRPLSNMTENEEVEYNMLRYVQRATPVHQIMVRIDSPESFRYLLSHEFDLFGLIEAGLAINKTTLSKEQQ